MKRRRTKTASKTLLSEAAVSSKKQILNGLKGMKPGAAMMLISKQLGKKTIPFLLTHLAPIVVQAAKSGKVKFDKIKDAVKGFNDKNNDDTTNIDFDKAEINSSSTRFKCMFDGDSGKMIKDYQTKLIKQLEDASGGSKKEPDVKESMKINNHLTKLFKTLNESKSLVTEAKESTALPLATIRKINSWYSDHWYETVPGAKELRDQIMANSTESSFKAGEKMFGFFDYHNSKLSPEQFEALNSKWRNMQAKFGSMAFRGQEITQTINGKGVRLITYGGDENFRRALAYAEEHSEVAGNLSEIRQKMVSGAAKISGALDDVPKGKAGSMMGKAMDLDDAKPTGRTISGAAAAQKFEDEHYQNAVKSTLAKGQAAVKLPNGKLYPWQKDVMQKQLDKLDDAFDFGKVTPQKIAQLKAYDEQMRGFQQFAERYQNSPNSQMRRQARQINAMLAKYQDFKDEHAAKLKKIGFAATDGKVSSDEVERAMEGNGDVKDAAQQTKKKFGLGDAFTAIGIMRLVAKTTGVALNNGKSLIDMVARQKMTKKEDENIIASMNFMLSNGDDNDSKHDDTEFSVRFDVSDCKWHATCIDDRKMKIPEEKLIKLALSSDDGQKFKKSCLSKWAKIFDGDKRLANLLVMTFQSIAAADKKTKPISDVLQKMHAKYNDIKKEFETKA